MTCSNDARSKLGENGTKWNIMIKRHNTRKITKQEDARAHIKNTYEGKGRKRKKNDNTWKNKIIIKGIIWAGTAGTIKTVTKPYVHGRNKRKNIK